MDLAGVGLKLLEGLAGLVVTVVGPILTKKIHDADVRQAIITVADAALTLVIAKAKSGTISDLATLLQQVVDTMLADPLAPKSLAGNPAKAQQAAAAALARAGLAGVQAVHVNPDGSLVPVTRAPLK